MAFPVSSRVTRRLRSPLVLLLSTALLLGLAVPGRAQVFDLEPPERYVLPNGLEVILSRDDRLPSVAIWLRYDVGGRDDPADYTGLAHMVEHMTFRGSRHVGEAEMLTRLEQVGAERANATTHPDWTAYYSVVPAHQVPLVLWLESERMAFTLEAMTDEKFQIERDVVLNEVAPRQSRLPEFLNQALYPPDNVYHRIGDPQRDEAAFTLENVRWFYQRWYRPDNATLTLVGSFDKARVKREIEKYFGPIVAAGPRPTRERAAPTPLVGTAELYVGAPLDREFVVVSWLAMCSVSDCGADLLLLDEVLSGTTEAELRRVLVRENRLATDVSFSASPYETHTELAIAADVHLGVETELVRKGIDAVVRRIQETPLDSQTLQQAKIALKTRIIGGFAPLLDRASALSNYRSTRGRDVLYEPNDVLAAISEITPEQLRDAARRYLPLERRVVLYAQKNRSAPGRGTLTRQVGSALPSALRDATDLGEK